MVPDRHLAGHILIWSSCFSIELAIISHIPFEWLLMIANNIYIYTCTYTYVYIYVSTFNYLMVGFLINYVIIISYKDTYIRLYSGWHHFPIIIHNIPCISPLYPDEWLVTSPSVSGFSVFVGDSPTAKTLPLGRAVHDLRVQEGRVLPLGSGRIPTQLGAVSSPRNMGKGAESQGKTEDFQVPGGSI